MLSVDISALVVFFLVWILLIILTKIFYNPLRKIMTERKLKIQKKVDASDDATAEYERTVGEIEESVKSAKASAFATMERFEKDALAEKEKIMEDISNECRAQIQKARQEIEKQLSDIKRELDAESEELAHKIEKKLLN
jgi:F-type H+-transporting ATPase subunit b